MGKKVEKTRKLIAITKNLSLINGWIKCIIKWRIIIFIFRIIVRSIFRISLEQSNHLRKIKYQISVDRKGYK